MPAPASIRAIKATMLRWIRIVAWGAVGVLGLLMLTVTGGWLVTDGPMAPRQLTSGPQTLPIGGPFKLTDQRGRAVTERDFRGRPMAIFFGFTHCPDVCPTTLTDMTNLMAALGPTGERVQWVFVSIDWERDTPRAMADYLTAFDPRITGLSGSEEEIRQVARSFRIFYRRVPLEGGGYTMDHSASLFLLDGQGRFAGTVDYKESEAVALEKLRLLAAGA